MRVFNKEERLVPPFLCFICETSPQREAGVHVIDTGWNFDPPAQTPLNGRKLVCERCVAAMANLLGYRSTDQVDEAVTALKDARDLLMPLQGVIRSLASDIEKRTANLFNLPFIEQTETSKVIQDEKKAEKEEESQ